ncbi:MAG: hypothetical protein QM759_09375 [Terricaulis sp.]
MTPFLAAQLLGALSALAMFVFWFLGMMSERRSNPDATGLRSSGLHPFRGGAGLASLDTTTRRRYTVAGLFWVVFAIIQVVDQATSFVGRPWARFSAPVAIGIYVVTSLWIVWSLVVARNIANRAG